MIPCLLITYNRLEYTKKALGALCRSDVDQIIIIDNGSTDGTAEWLRDLFKNFPYAMKSKIGVHWNVTANHSIAYAMNLFLDITKGCKIVSKVDNDTLIPNNFKRKMTPHMEHADIVQAKHDILPATHPQGFDAWVSTMPAKGDLRFNHFVGGSGIMFRHPGGPVIPETNWVLGGWRQYQRDNPSLRKAFATNVKIRLLDTSATGPDYSQYPDYYKKTKRI